MENEKCIRIRSGKLSRCENYYRGSDTLSINGEIKYFCRGCDADLTQYVKDQNRDTFKGKAAFARMAIKGKLKTRNFVSDKDLRDKYTVETGEKWFNLDGEPDIEYVYWLENLVLGISDRTSK